MFIYGRHENEMVLALSVIEATKTKNKTVFDSYRCINH